MSEGSRTGQHLPANGSPPEFQEGENKIDSQELDTTDQEKEHTPDIEHESDLSEYQPEQPDTQV